MRFAQTITMFALLLLVSACGYHLLGKEVHLPGGVSKIYVETAENKTMEDGLEQLFTQRLLEHLNADGRIKLVNKNEADGILKSEILKAQEMPLAFDKFGRVTLLQVEVSAQVILLASKENKKLWDSGILLEREEYPVGDDFLRNDRLRDSALDQISQRLSRTVVELLTSDF